MAEHGPDGHAGGRRHRPLPEHEAAAVEPTVLVGLRGIRELRGVAARRGRRARDRRRDHAHRGVARTPRCARDYAGAGHRGRRGLHAAAAQHGHDRRQPVPRHALQLLQPDLRVAEGDRLLHEEGRRHLPGRAGQPALLGGVVLRHRARAVALGAQRAPGRPRRRAHDPDRRRSTRTTASSTSTKRPDEILTEIVLPPADGLALAPTGSCAAAARSTSRCSGVAAALRMDGRHRARGPHRARRGGLAAARGGRGRARCWSASASRPELIDARGRRRVPAREAARQHRPHPSLPQEDDARVRGARARARLAGLPTRPAERVTALGERIKALARRARAAAAPARREGRADPEHGLADRVGAADALAATPWASWPPPSACPIAPLFEPAPAGRLHVTPEDATTRWCRSTAPPRSGTCSAPGSSRARSGRWSPRSGRASRGVKTEKVVIKPGPDEALLRASRARWRSTTTVSATCSRRATAPTSTAARPHGWENLGTRRRQGALGDPRLRETRRWRTTASA